MIKRLRRPLSTLTVTLCCVTFPGAPATAAPDEVPVWRVNATAVEGAASELRNVRLASATTYVMARRAVASPQTIEVFDATVYVGDWSLSAARLTIDLRVDAVTITTLRTDAPQE